MRQRMWARRGVLALCLALLGCDPKPATQMPEYASRPANRAGDKATWVLAVHPLHNPELLHERYGPLLQWANLRLDDVELRLEASIDYPQFETKLRSRIPELALPNPYQVVQAQQWGYHVVAKVAGDDDFRGLILRRRGAAMPAPGEPLRVSCPALTALAGCMMPRWQLHQEGLDRTYRVKIEVVGSQESSILNVAQGLVDLAFTWPPPWRLFQQREPAIAAELEVYRSTEPLVNNGLVARDDLDPRRVVRVVQALVELARDPQGQRLLQAAGLQGFEPADERAYEPVRRFMQAYQQAFGALP